MQYCLLISPLPLIGPYLTLDHPDDAAVGQHGVGAKDKKEVWEVWNCHPEVGGGVLIQAISELQIMPGQNCVLSCFI